MQRGFSLPIILIGILVLGLIGGGLFYFFGTDCYNRTFTRCYAMGAIPSKNYEEQKKLVPPKEASPADVLDETTNWETYKNEKYKYEFQYPDYWSKMNCEDIKSDMWVAIGPEFMHDPSALCHTDRFPTLSFNIYNTPEPGEYYKATSSEKIMVGNKQADYIIVENIGAPGPKYFTQVNIPFNGRFIVGVLNNVDYEFEFKKILSTFKFTN